MSKFFSTALLVSCATAQMTTSAWMPGGEGSDVTYEASVMNVENDRTTLSVSFPGLDDVTNIVDQLAQTVTIAGNTYYAFNAEVAEDGITVNLAGECTRKNTDAEEATCTMTTKGLDEALSSVCEGPDAISELCTGGALDTSTTTTLPAGYFSMAEIVITAGGDSLPDASAAATASASSATATASESDDSEPASETDSPTSSGTEAASSGASQTSGSPEEATGAAPMMTMVPALAGLGAAAAFFL